MATVSVAIAAAGAPTVQLSASPPGVAPGTATTLTWSTTDATDCTASGAWSGPKGSSGSESTGNLNQDQTYELSCTGPGGTALAMTTVTVRAASLSWEAPTENVDGTPLTNLSGFTVHWGNASRNYTESVTFNDPTKLDYFVELSPNTYFFAVTALASDGGESAFSGEVSKTIF
jgi:hypothetical protein